MIFEYARHTRVFVKKNNVSALILDYPVATFEDRDTAVFCALIGSYILIYFMISELKTVLSDQCLCERVILVPLTYVGIEVNVWENIIKGQNERLLDSL
jgi:hypothetical protein